MIKTSLFPFKKCLLELRQRPCTKSPEGGPGAARPVGEILSREPAPQPGGRSRGQLTGTGLGRSSAVLGWFCNGTYLQWNRSRQLQGYDCDRRLGNAQCSPDQRQMGASRSYRSPGTDTSSDLTRWPRPRGQDRAPGPGPAGRRRLPDSRPGRTEDDDPRGPTAAPTRLSGSWLAATRASRLDTYLGLPAAPPAAPTGSPAASRKSSWAATPNRQPPLPPSQSAEGVDAPGSRAPSLRWAQAGRGTGGGAKNGGRGDGAGAGRGRHTKATGPWRLWRRKSVCSLQGLSIDRLNSANSVNTPWHRRYVYEGG